MKLEAEVLKFIFCFFVIFRSRHFQKCLEGFEFGQIFIVKIIISRKDQTENYKRWVLPCLWWY